jgi:hypothetical protein
MCPGPCFVGALLESEFPLPKEDRCANRAITSHDVTEQGLATDAIRTILSCPA